MQPVPECRLYTADLQRNVVLLIEFRNYANLINITKGYMTKKWPLRPYYREKEEWIFLSAISINPQIISDMLAARCPVEYHNYDQVKANMASREATILEIIPPEDSS